MFNLDKYKGLARTTYTLDPAAVDPGWVNSVSSVQGQGKVSRDITQNRPGGTIDLFAGGPESKAAIEIPVFFGNSARSLAAVVVNTERMTFSGMRPTGRIEMVQRGSSNPRRAGLVLEETGASAVTTDGSEEVKTMIMSGNMTQSENAHVGFMVDFLDNTFEGNVGYSPVFLNMLSTSGVYSVRISNESKTSPAYYNHTLGVGLVEITLIWNKPGKATEVMLGNTPSPVWISSVNPVSATVASGDSLPLGRDQVLAWQSVIGDSDGWTHNESTGWLTVQEGRWRIDVSVTVESSGSGPIELRAMTTDGRVLSVSRANVNPGQVMTLSTGVLTALTHNQQVRFVLNNASSGSVSVSDDVRTGNFSLVRIAAENRLVA